MRPKNQLAITSSKHPDIWKKADALREGSDEWPSWCFLPVDHWQKVIATPGTNPEDVFEAAAVGTWRIGQGVYRFDPTLYEALIMTMPAGDIAAEVLYRLPEWCIYVETPYSSWPNGSAQGFWALLDFDIYTGNHSLLLAIDDCERQSADPLPTIILPIGTWSIRDAHNQVLKDSTFSKKNMQTEKALLEFLSLLLFICSDAPGIESATKPGMLPERPRPTRTKNGWRLYAATNPRVWNVGREIGLLLDKDNWATTPMGQPYIAPIQVKKASWSGEWKELEGGKKRYQYRWNPPKAIN